MTDFGMRSRPEAPPGRLILRHYANNKNEAIKQHADLVFGIPGAEWVLLVVRLGACSRARARWLHHSLDRRDRLLRSLRRQRSAYAAPRGSQDTDEFLVINKPTIAQYVDGLEARHPVDVIQFRWVLYEHMHPFCSTQPFGQTMIADDPPGLVASYHLKSMTKLALPGLNLLTPHYPTMRDQTSRTYRRVLDGVARNVSAAEVQRAAPAVTARRPYFDSALVHVHTRSLADLLIKSAHGLSSKIRKPASRIALSRLIRGASVTWTDAGMGGLAEQFATIGGTKARLPASHYAKGLAIARELKFDASYAGARVMRMLREMRIPAKLAARSICDQAAERFEFTRFLKTLNVSYSEYLGFARALEVEFRRKCARSRAAAQEVVAGHNAGR
jgi:hypothetical protein